MWRVTSLIICRNYTSSEVADLDNDANAPPASKISKAPKAGEREP